MIEFLDRMSDEAIVELNIPTGQPPVYEPSDGLEPVRDYYLGDEDAIMRSIAAVASQGRVSR